MIEVLVIGIGEYVTGLSGEKGANSDKSLGVIALSLFDMRERGLIKNITLCGRDADKFSIIQKHFKTNMNKLYPTLDVSFESYPKNGINNKGYKEAIDSMPKGSAVLVFTPDNTHFEITQYALEKNMHVQVAKPLVKTFNEHNILDMIAQKNDRLCMLEVHKRFDPIYANAKERIQDMGGVSYFHSYMSQPHTQLDTFRSWAGISSDISYYLNSHHIDFLLWAVSDFATPISVYATSSNGVGKEKLQREIEDTITLTIEWKNSDGTLGHSIHTASWIAPKSDVHSQQRFFYMGQKGEINVDQAHRGYNASIDDTYQSINPLFWNYTPVGGKFVGQNTYGYKSIETFILSATKLQNKSATIKDFDRYLPTIANTKLLTKILEAGRISLDKNQKIILD